MVRSAVGAGAASASRPTPRRPLTACTGTVRAMCSIAAAAGVDVVDEIGLGEHDHRRGAAVVGQHELAFQPALVGRRGSSA